VLLGLLAALVALGSATGCATRPSSDRIVNRYGLDIYLQSEKKMFGGAIDRGFDHPAKISRDRIEAILSSIEIERRLDGSAFERVPAIQPELLNDVAIGVAQA